MESKTKAGVTLASGASHPMLTSSQALEIAFSATKSFPDRDKPGDIVVELKSSVFQIRFFFAIAQDRKLEHLVEVSVDSSSGRVLNTEDKGRVAGLQGRSADQGWETFVSAKQAYDFALAAIKGFEDYDKQGALTVELRKDVYYVTFPLKRSEQMGARAPDFATQVWIDARSGKVLKRLVAS